MFLSSFLPFALALTAIHRTNAYIYKTNFPNVTWDDDHWIIYNNNLDQGHYQSRLSLSNGYFGINVASVGPFFEVDEKVDGDNVNTWPLYGRRQTFATITGFYDSQPLTNDSNFPWLFQYGGESIISGIPHWAGLAVKAGAGHILSASVDSSQISNFRSTLDIGAGGLVTWSYTWTPPDFIPLDVEYSMFVHKLYINQAAIRLKLRASRNVNVTVIDMLHGDCAVRTDFVDSGFEGDSSAIWTAVSPWGLSDITAYVYSSLQGVKGTNLTSRAKFGDESLIGANTSSIAQSVVVSLTAGETATIEKYVGAASNDHFDDPQSVARNASKSGISSGFATMLKSHSTEWQSILTRESVDDYSPPDGSPIEDDNVLELQITAVTNPFQLLQEIISNNAHALVQDAKNVDGNSVPVDGLGSDSYVGQVFWDADVWVAPGLAIAHPTAVRQIVMKRVYQYGQAQENMKTAYQSSRNATTFNGNAAIYPWTTGRFGNCTAVGPCFDYEYHVNGAVGLGLYNYLAATGDWNFFKERLWPIYKSVAYLYSDLLSWNETKQAYELYNSTDPDEYTNLVDNAGYTQALISTHLRTANSLGEQLGEPKNRDWLDKSEMIYLPINKAANIIMEYETMNGTVAPKVSGVILIHDFLDYANRYSLSDLEFYAGKQSPNGPAMTFGFSIMANEFSQSGCSAYTFDISSTRPFLRGPWFQYSEQKDDTYTENGHTHPAFPFLTASGGAYRVAVFGYLGLRLQVSALNINPNLPPQLQRLKYRRFYWQGHAIDASSNSTHTTLTRLPIRLSNGNSTFDTAPIPVTLRYNQLATFLPVNGTIVVKNRRTGDINTFTNNIAQCKPAFSDQVAVPGQIPISAVDGSISTKWQPSRANEWSSLLVNLTGSRYYPISRIYFDWGQEPPTSYSVVFHNQSELTPGTIVNVTSSNNVTLSVPFDFAKGNDVVAYASNTTNITLLRPIWSGRFATLFITGNQNLTHGKTSPGASVAELAIIAADLIEDGTNPWAYVAQFPITTVDGTLK